MNPNTEDHQPKPIEARVQELERYVTRLRIGLIAISSLIIWQATSSMGWLGPVRLYATEVYASQYILEDEDQQVYGRWDVRDDRPAQLTMFGSDREYIRLNADGLEQLSGRDLP